MRKIYYKNHGEKCKVVILIIFLFTISVTNSQSIVYAQSISSESNVDNGANAINQDPSNYAVVRASTGVAVGIGSYSGHLELEFPSVLNANTTTYVKVEAQDNLFDVLLGGSLGNLLSDVLGIVLIGNQEFSIQAKLNNSVLLTGNSQIANDFATPNLKVVINSLGEHFIAITPNSAYNRIRLTNRVGSLLGLNNTKQLKVYGAYYVDEVDACGRPSYTSFDGNGLTLDLLNLAGAGVTNPENVIDSDLNSYSELSLGILDVVASIEQVVYFDGLSNPNDVFNIRMRIDPSLIALGVFNNVTITSYQGANLGNIISLNSLVNLELLNLMQNNEIVTIPYSSGMAVDRIAVKYSSIVNTSLFQKLDLFDIQRVPASATIDASSMNQMICSGNTANIIAYSNPNTLQLYWYDVPSGGTAVAVTNSGETFTTPILTATTTFYVAVRDQNCTQESERVAVEVIVNPSPTSNDISITGNENIICAINPVILTPSSTITGSFNWYFDANATNVISDGLIIGNITYSIDANGILTITGLTTSNSPETYYVSVTDSNTSCSNASGDLKEVIITISDAATPTTVSATQNFCSSQNATISDLQVNESPINWYSTATGGTSIPITTLLTAGTYYASIVGSSCESSIRLEVTVNINDLATPTTTNMTQDFCSSQNATLADLQVNESPIIWYSASSGGTPLPINTVLTNNTTYYAALTRSNCESSIRLLVTSIINNDSQATINGAFSNVCFSNDYTYTTESNMSNYQWVVTGGVILNGGTSTSDYVTVNWNQNTLGNVSVSYDGPSLCNGMASFSQDVAINSCSDITITKVANESQAAIGETITFTITVSNNGSSNISIIEVLENIPSGYNYVSNTTSNGQYDFASGIWSINNLLANTVATLQVNVTVNPTGNYTNTASILNSDPEDTDSSNNVAVASVEVSCLIVYNEFSPNNDGQNEYFIIDCIENYPSNKLEVFNRYGNIVYETEAYKNTWNGISNVSGVVNRGETLPVGTYFYSLQINELNMTRSGWLYIAK